MTLPEKKAITVQFQIFDPELTRFWAAAKGLIIFYFQHLVLTFLGFLAQMIGRSLCIFFAGILSFTVSAQAPKKYNLFDLEDGDVYWRNTYAFSGPAEDLRPLVVQMLKSKFFTFNVVRNEAGYIGEIRHFKVDCKRYGRTYLKTPRMYWDGEWTGKFVVKVFADRYEVIVYALYAEKIEQNVGYYKSEKTVSGRYVDIVTKKGKGFRKNESGNLDLLSISLKDSFDIAVKSED